MDNKINDFCNFKEYIQAYMQKEIGDYSDQESKTAIALIQRAKNYESIKHAVYVMGASSSSGGEIWIALIEEYYILS